jgi:hypothetical protein
MSGWRATGRKRRLDPRTRGRPLFLSAFYDGFQGDAGSRTQLARSNSTSRWLSTDWLPGENLSIVLADTYHIPDHDFGIRGEGNA